jgi:prolyl 4-hydroxylase
MIVFWIFLSFATGLRAAVNLAADPPEYGVDCSYPIHYGIQKKECPYFYEVYNKMMVGCFKLYSKRECEANEADRLKMNLAQPPTQHNYTTVGFKFGKVPQQIWDPLLKFYNQYKDKMKEEKWYRGSTVVNSWESKSYMISFEDPELKGGLALKQQIWNAMKPVIEEWVGHKLEPTSLYGVRVYTEGAVLATRKFFLFHLKFIFTFRIY